MRSEQASITSFFKRADSPRGVCQPVPSTQETPATVKRARVPDDRATLLPKKPKLTDAPQGNSLASSQDEKAVICLDEASSSSFSSSSRPGFRTSLRESSLRARHKLARVHDEPDVDADDDASGGEQEAVEKPKAREYDAIIADALQGFQYQQGRRGAQDRPVEKIKAAGNKAVERKAGEALQRPNRSKSKAKLSKVEEADEGTAEGIEELEESSRGRMLAWKYKCEEQFSQVLSEALESQGKSDTSRRLEEGASAVSLPKPRPSSKAAEVEKPDMSEYEKARLANINRNKSFLMNLGIESLAPAVELKVPVKSRRPRWRRSCRCSLH
eukprot:757408-Hanusia_phi.AAC.11